MTQGKNGKQHTLIDSHVRILSQAGVEPLTCLWAPHDGGRPYTPTGRRRKGQVPAASQHTGENSNPDTSVTPFCINWNEQLNPLGEIRPTLWVGRTFLAVYIQRYLWHPIRRITRISKWHWKVLGETPIKTLSTQSKQTATYYSSKAMCIGIWLYCIASIHLYSASCSAHQSDALPVRETQREESSLERTKRGTWLSSYKVDRVEGRRWFQSEGPMIAKARVWAIEVLARGTKRSWRSSERSGRREMAEEGRRIRSRKYLGAWPICER